jgi:hypothetical protein
MLTPKSQLIHRVSRGTHTLKRRLKRRPQLAGECSHRRTVLVARLDALRQNQRRLTVR